jgi:hypothetical protein
VKCSGGTGESPDDWILARILVLWTHRSACRRETVSIRHIHSSGFRWKNELRGGWCLSKASSVGFPEEWAPGLDPLFDDILPNSAEVFGCGVSKPEKKKNPPRQPFSNGPGSRESSSSAFLAAVWLAYSAGICWFFGAACSLRWLPSMEPLGRPFRQSHRCFGRLPTLLCWPDHPDAAHWPAGGLTLLSLSA